MKKLIFLLFFLVIPFVNADWLDDGSCQINTNCIISRQVINESTSGIVSDANCTINIYDVNNSLIINDTMVNLTSGYQNYTINMNRTGQFPSDMYCIYQENHTAKADVTFVVSDPHYNEWLYLFLFIIPVILFVLGKKEGELSYIMIAGFILVLFGMGVLIGWFPRFENNFLTNLFSVVLFGLGFYLIGDSAMGYVGGGF